MIDCFMFFNELDLLEIRLNSLASYIERFVLCECPVTHSGQPKPLYFDQNRERFKDFNITHLVFEDYKGRAPMEMDHVQRDYLINGIQDVDPEEIVLLSDLDEIPDLRYYLGEQGIFKHKLYYFYLNTYNGVPNWRGTIAIKRKSVISLNALRSRRGRIASNGHRGWHFSTLGMADNVVHKIESFAHQELNLPDVKSKIAANREGLYDPYNRGDQHLIVEDIAGPEWLVQNQHRYEHLIYRGERYER